MKIVLLGPPGAGKGTLSNAIKEHYGVIHIAMGDILRDEMKGKSPLGLKIKQYVENGKLVPDEVVTAIIEKRLTEDQKVKKGYLLDGYPRNPHQAKDLDKILDRIRQPLDCALYMEASLPTIIQRLSGRRVCRNCGAVFHIKNRPPKVSSRCDHCNDELYQRPDDNEETIKTRMDVYLKNTAPLVDYYQKQEKLKKVNGDQDSQDLFKSLVQAWNEETKSLPPFKKF